MYCTICLSLFVRKIIIHFQLYLKFLKIFFVIFFRCKIYDKINIFYYISLLGCLFTVGGLIFKNKFPSRTKKLCKPDRSTLSRIDVSSMTHLKNLFTSHTKVIVVRILRISNIKNKPILKNFIYLTTKISKSLSSVRMSYKEKAIGSPETSSSPVTLFYFSPGKPRTGTGDKWDADFARSPSVI